MINIGICGAAGRMGQAVIKATCADPELNVSAALVRPGHQWLGSSLNRIISITASDALITDDPAKAADSCQVLIDFSSPEAAISLAEAAANAGIPLVSGTSGLNDAQLGLLARLAEKLPILWAANMSLAVNVMLKLVREVAGYLGEAYAVEILDAYHDQKKDAPSGTAMALIRELAGAYGWPQEEVSRFGREGDIGPRSQREIGVHAIRGGDLPGENTVYFMGKGERLELSCRAQSRQPAVQGALRAALWIKGREPGLYSMSHVLGLEPSGEGKPAFRRVPGKRS